MCGMGTGAFCDFYFIIFFVNRERTHIYIKVHRVMSELGQSPRVYTWQVYHRSAVPYLRHILCLVAVDLPVSLTMPVVTLERFEHLVPEDCPAQAGDVNVGTEGPAGMLSAPDFIHGRGEV